MPDPKGSWIILSLKMQLDHIVDLTLPAEQKVIGTTLQELTGDWVDYNPGEAPTQRLGEALYSIPNLEGFLYPSSPSSQVNSNNLVIFPDKLGPRSEIAFLNEMTGNVERLT